ncbi:MAG: 8-oxo-dGTP diphosphatase [Streptococcus sp.]|nr:8-oxo-dGTP diphosphatase [Streptococcus sp.]
MTERIFNWVNIVVKKDDQILLLNRQHDDFKGWIPPGGKVEFPESFFEAAIRELKEETGLTALNLHLKGLSGFTNPTKKERFVYYDFVCDRFSGQLKESREGQPKWWHISELENLEMQTDIRNRLPLYLRSGSFESITYWNEEKQCIEKNITKTYE